MASQLSGFREKRILRDYDARLTPGKKTGGTGSVLLVTCSNPVRLGWPSKYLGYRGHISEGTATQRYICIEKKTGII